MINSTLNLMYLEIEKWFLHKRLQITCLVAPLTFCFWCNDEESNWNVHYIFLFESNLKNESNSEWSVGNVFRIITQFLSLVISIQRLSGDMEGLAVKYDMISALNCHCDSRNLSCSTWLRLRSKVLSLESTLPEIIISNSSSSGVLLVRARELEDEQNLLLGNLDRI